MSYRIHTDRVIELVKLAYPTRDASIEDVVFATAVAKEAWMRGMEEAMSICRTNRAWREVDAIRIYMKQQLEK